MGPFEFIILFLSFIYALALTHLLLAAARMVRFRRRIRFSGPHALWMLVALLSLAGNWLSTWDFHSQRRLSLATIGLAIFFAILNYLLCALVSPEFDDAEDFDLRRFHEREGPTYIGARLVLGLAAMAVNFAAASELGLKSWAEQNIGIVLVLALCTLALLVRRTWVQWLVPAAIVIFFITVFEIFYPVLA